jgi:hypothetical protein
MSALKTTAATVVEKFEGVDGKIQYLSWAYTLKTILKQHGLWTVTEKGIDEAAKEEKATTERKRQRQKRKMNWRSRVFT